MLLRRFLNPTRYLPDFKFDNKYVRTYRQVLKVVLLKNLYINYTHRHTPLLSVSLICSLRWWSNPRLMDVYQFITSVMELSSGSKRTRSLNSFSRLWNSYRFSIISRSSSSSSGAVGTLISLQVVMLFRAWSVFANLKVRLALFLKSKDYWFRNCKKTYRCLLPLVKM